jgi:hypothetical protein
VRQRFNSLVKAGKVFTQDVEVQRSKYKAEYCEEVIRMASAGYSLRAFCGNIGVAYETMTTWRATMPQFNEACREAEMKRHLFYEHTSLKNLNNKDFNNPLFKTLTSVVVRWKETTIHDIKVNGETTMSLEIPTIEPNLLTADERKEKIKQLTAELEIE